MSPNKGGRDGVTLDPATEAEDHQIRDEYEIVLIRETRRGQGRKLHIPIEENELRPLCGGKGDTSFIDKDVSVFPPGFHDFCSDCVTEWRDDDE